MRGSLSATRDGLVSVQSAQCRAKWSVAVRTQADE